MNHGISSLAHPSAPIPRSHHLLIASQRTDGLYEMKTGRRQSSHWVGHASAHSPGLLDGLYEGCHIMSTRTGISLRMGTVKNEGGSILKSASVEGTTPVM